MIELFGYNQKSQDPFLLDIQNQGEVSLNYEVGDIGDLVGRSSPYSQTFTLPFTNNNNKFFRQFYNINVETDLILTTDYAVFDPNIKTPCDIRVDGIPIITGSFQLLKCSLKSRVYEIVVLGSESDFFNSLGDKKLIDAFRLSASSSSLVDTYNVNINDTNIVDSWDLSNDVTEGGVGDGVIIFPLIDYGLVGDYNFLYLEADSMGNGGLVEPSFLQPQDLRPSIQLKALFDLIIKEAGFSLTNNAFLASDAWTKAYMTLGTDRESTAITTAHQSQVANTASAIIQTWGIGGVDSGDWETILFPNQSGAGYGSNPPSLYDSGDDWNVGGEFVVPYNGSYSGIFVTRWNSGPSSIAQGATIKINVSTPNAVGGAFNTILFSVEQSFEGNDGGIPILNTFTFPWNINALAGETIRFNAQAQVESGYSVDLMASSTYVKIVGSNTMAGEADIPSNMPDISQKDFITDIVQRFNLVLISDTSSPTILTVMPWQDYIDLGTRKDWTQKIDVSQEQTISTTTKYKKQLINYSDLEDEDNRNVSNQNTYGSVFGSYTQKITGDYLTGTLENKSVFSPFSVNPVPRQDDSSLTDAPTLLIHQGYAHGTGGPLASCKPKLFYHNGLKYQSPKIYIGQTQSYYYPLCLPFYNAGDQMAVDSPMLYWQFQTPGSWGGPIFGTTPSSEGYFKRYWQEFLSSYYDKSARILDCSVYLTASDVHNFEFNDEIVIEDTAYRVLRISGFQPFANVPTKVQLLKKINNVGALQLPDPSDLCSATPYAWFPSGIVGFQDNETGATVVSEECCNTYHYNWIDDNCYWNYGGGGGGAGDPTTGLGGWNPHGNPNDGTVGGVADEKGKGGFSSRKSKGVPNINPTFGEHSIRGNNIESQANSVFKNFVYYATSEDTTARIATATGIEATNSRIPIAYNTMARLTIRALSVQTHVLSGGSGSYGSSSFNVWTFMVKNVDGVITVNTDGGEQLDFRQADADAGTRTVDVVSAAGKAGFAGNRGVNITCTGPADSIVAWHLDCAVTYVDFGYPKTLTNLILTEGGDFLITENDDYLEQE
tara:strand:+ start:3506 stop:6670 length:3165 start_codon:yes stop_codon:yes gene_type:complete